jgi:hypothetical protein
VRALAPLWLASLAAALLAGCGQSAQVRLQRHEIVYQQRVAAIDKPFAHPSAKPRRDEQLLRRAIAEYEALRPPPPLRGLDAQLIEGLKRELEAFSNGLAANGNPAGVTRAEGLGARARAEVNRALRRLGALIGACRANAARC